MAIPYKLPIELFDKVETPFYYYDTALLHDTLNALKQCIQNMPYEVHYAIKANANPSIVRQIAEAGLGADCVSGGEVRLALACGVPAHKIAFAGVGKKDWEIRLGLEAGIACFNVESLEELEVINTLAQERGVQAPCALRINPNIDAHTHANITTGLDDNKFGIPVIALRHAIERANTLENIDFKGLHFHIGSQTTEYTPFVKLCELINTLQEQLEQEGITLPSINVGGGLGVSYTTPNEMLIPDFEGYFETFKKNLHLRAEQTLHFELGRSIVAQCGALISEVILVKQGRNKQFLIVDAGFTDLIRPALYDAYHQIDALVDHTETTTYDVVGPICESSDVFAKAIVLPTLQRGDLIALRTAGAYGEVMASTYNTRELIKGYTTEELKALHQQ